MRSIYFKTLLLVLILFSLSSMCRATMYSYKDSSGTIHFTNVPSSPKYKPIWGLPSHLNTTRREFLFDSHIGDAARLFNLDPSLIKAIIKRESDFNPKAVSPKGAVGLMQLMPDTAREMNVTDIYDPRENIFGGSRYLKRLSKLFPQDLDLILASYNAGPDRILATRTIPDIRETKQFVKSVRRFYRHYKSAGYGGWR